VPVYAALIYSIWRGRHRFEVHALLLFIGLLSGFHALQELDFDQRYRIPGLWAMVALASLSIPSGRMTADGRAA
jgi:NhaP-type Na+/H+ and K+/H+ antiporter